MTKKNPWVEFHQQKPASLLDLYCFPYAGGGAQIFKPWHAKLPEEVELYPIQLPGRWTRFQEEPFTRITDLVNTLTEVLPVHANKPFALFGHSLGATIAYELSCKLKSINGPQPSTLFLAAQAAPHIPRKHEAIAALPNQEFIQKINTYYNGIPDEILNNAKLLAVLLPTIRADMEMVETYSYRNAAPLDVPFTILGGHQDPAVSQEDLEAWKSHTTESISVHMIEGQHFFLHTAEDVVLQKISRAIRKTISEG